MTLSDAHAAIAGWAASTWAEDNLLSYLPSNTDAGLPTAVVDWWQPPHEMALPAEICDELLSDARSTMPGAAGNGTYYFVSPGVDAQAAVFGRVSQANEVWWRLDVARWTGGVKRYTVGECHPEHMDWYPAPGECRKLSVSVQLSGPDDYTGGDLTVRYAGHRLELPRARGTLGVWPGWVHHEVEPVTSGERWSLVVHGFGPALR